MRMYDIIKKKRDGFELSKAEIDFFVKGYTSGEIPDEQVSALLMVIYFNKMTDRETFELTDCIVRSGEVIDLSSIDGIKVDKHSTGGVGDKTSLIVVPIVASCGVKVAKMSGRGLGHTGGTIDKLESIPGYRTSLNEDEFFNIVKEVGCSIIGQSKDLAPADKKLYALRDVTATIDNSSLIAASIMGKKLASGADKIVLDVKVGSGSFNKTLDQAENLSKLMVSIAKNSKKDAVALITNMEKPLGNAIGNSLEVIECIEVLQGKTGDLYDLSIELAANMLYLANLGDIDYCRTMAKESVKTGKALAKLAEMVKAHGGDADYIFEPNKFKKASLTKAVKSQSSGYIARINAEMYGLASVTLGAGRNRKEDIIDHSAGIILNKNLGDFVEKGDVFATLYSSKEETFSEAEADVIRATKISGEKPKDFPLIFKRIEN